MFGLSIAEDIYGLNEAPGCQRSGNRGPQTCLPAAHGVAKQVGRTAHLHQQGIQDPREGPSLARRTTQDLLWSGLARQAHEEQRYQGGAKPHEALVT